MGKKLTKALKDAIYADLMKDWQQVYITSDVHIGLDISPSRMYTNHVIIQGDVAVGYTHYWRMSKPLVVTPAQRVLINDILSDHGDVIATYQNDDKGLHFNGAPDDHEDMYVGYGKQTAFSFCKTARKAYDVAVCKVLRVLSASPGFTFSSDGDVDGGEEGWAEANNWWAKNKSRLDIKSGIVDNKPLTQEGAVDASKVTFLRLENTTKGHNKFWEINAVSEKEVEAKWGPNGKAPQGSKIYTNAEAEKLVQEKLKKGYKVVGMR